MSERYQILLGHVPEIAGVIDTLVRMLEARYPVDFRVVQRDDYPPDDEEFFTFGDHFFIWCEAKHMMMAGSRLDMPGGYPSNIVGRISQIIDGFLEADHWSGLMKIHGPMLNPKMVAELEKTEAEDRAKKDDLP